MVAAKENVGDTVQESFQTHDPNSIADWLLGSKPSSDWPRIQSCEQHFENSFQLHGIQVSGVIQKLSINRLTNLAKLPMTVNVHSKNVGDLVLFKIHIQHRP